MEGSLVAIVFWQAPLRDPRSNLDRHVQALKKLPISSYKWSSHTGRTPGNLGISHPRFPRYLEAALCAFRGAASREMADQLSAEDQMRSEPTEWSGVSQVEEGGPQVVADPGGESMLEAARRVAESDMRSQMVKSRAELLNQHSSATVSRINEKFGLVPSGLEASVGTAAEGVPRLSIAEGVPRLSINIARLDGKFSSPRTLEKGLWETPRRPAGQGDPGFAPSPSMSPGSPGVPDRAEEKQQAKEGHVLQQTPSPPQQQPVSSAPSASMKQRRAIQSAESLETALAQIEAISMGLPGPGWAQGGTGVRQPGNQPSECNAKELEGEIALLREKKAALKESFMQVIGGKSQAGDIAMGASPRSSAVPGRRSSIDDIAPIQAVQPRPPSPQTEVKYRNATQQLQESLASEVAAPTPPAQRPALPEEGPGGPQEIVVPNRRWQGGRCPGREIDRYQRDVADTARIEVGRDVEIVGLHVTLEVVPHWPNIRYAPAPCGELDLSFDIQSVVVQAHRRCVARSACESCLSSLGWRTQAEVQGSSPRSTRTGMRVG